MDDFQFHFHSKLESCQFAFGYYENFALLFKGRDPDEWDEIVIGGGHQTYSPGTYLSTNYFTFTVTIRKSAAGRATFNDRMGNQSHDQNHAAALGEGKNRCQSDDLENQSSMADKDNQLPSEAPLDFQDLQFPKSGHTIGCPPYWPRDDQSGANYIVQNAILTAIQLRMRNSQQSSSQF